MLRWGDVVLAFRGGDLKGEGRVSGGTKKGREGGGGLLVQIPPEMESPTAPPTEYPVARIAVTEATSIITLDESVFFFFLKLA